MEGRTFVMARHGECVNDPSLDDSPLTIQGVWQSLKLGWNLKFKAKLKSTTILTSPKQRALQTAWAIRLFFPKTWFQKARFRKEEVLFVSAFNGDEVTPKLMKTIVDMMLEIDNNVVVVTHHQLTTGNVLKEIRKRKEVADKPFPPCKMNNGGAVSLCPKTHEIKTYGEVTMYY